MRLLLLGLLLITQVMAYSQPMKIGALAYAPPFSTKADASNNFYGFVIDLMNTICYRIEMQCVYVPIPKKGELWGLNQGLFDVTFSPSPVTSLLPDSYIFSLPYLPSNGQFVTLKTNSINSTHDIIQKKIGYYKIDFEAAPTLARFLNTNTFIQFKDPAELLNALLNKKVDVALINHYAARYIVTSIDRTSNSLMLVGKKMPIGNGYGVITLKKYNSLILKINHALLSMEKDGTYLKIYIKYFGYNSTYTETE